MSATTYTLTGNIRDALRTDASELQNLQGYLEPSQPAVADASDNTVSLGNVALSIDPSTGGFSVTLLGTGTLVAGWRLVLLYRDSSLAVSGRQVQNFTSGYFAMTANRTLVEALASSLALVPVDTSTLQSVYTARDAAATSAAIATANANGFTIGTTTTGTAGSAASASITGTAPNRQINFTVPAGANGGSDASTADNVANGTQTKTALNGTYAKYVSGVLSIAGSKVNATPKAVYDVRDYGAAVDGTTDDSTSVQSAINAASAAGGGEVYIPAQGSGATTSCKVNSTIILKTGVWLRGAGSTSVLTGTANPMIALPSSGSVVDRVTVSDLFLQSPTGVGIKLDTTGTSGGFQLGWPRITIQNVTVTDAGSHAFQVALSSVIETRFHNCVSMRAGGHGFLLSATDLFLSSCTAASGTSASFEGFMIQGGNNKLFGCKSYGNLGNGFNIAGAGRHVITGCEAQDNRKYGYLIDGSFNTVSGCLSDSDKLAGYFVGTNSVVSGCTAISGGGGSGQVAPVGVLLASTGARVTGLVCNLVTKVGGNVIDGANTIDVGQSGTRLLAYAATITPDPYSGDSQEIVLTGNTTIAAPTTFHRGQRLTFLLKQDPTGGRTVTFGAGFLTSWTPNTAANKLNVITFRHDGTSWAQESATVGLDRPALIADDFNRADSAGTLGSTSVGSLPWTNRLGSFGVSGNQAAPASFGGGNAIATIDPGRSSGRIRATFTAVPGGWGIVFRYVDTNNFLYTFGGSVAGKIAGVDLNYVSGLASPGAGDVVDIVMSGTSVAYVRNGTSLWTGVINDLATATSHGLLGQSTSNRVDDFSFQ